MHFKSTIKVVFTIMIAMFMETIMSTDTRYIKRVNEEEIIETREEQKSSISDTIPLTDRKGDFITDKTYNPFDVFPSTIKQKVEYDPVTDQYIIYEKIGDEYYRTPSYMTFDEYMEWSAKQQETAYFNSLAGIKAEKKSESGKLDPMEKIDVSKSLVDRLFGGSEINIKPQGSVDLSVGWLYSRRRDPNLPVRAQRQSQPEIRQPAIRMNVNGSIGKKLNLDFNYDTQANFNFDQLMKIGFNSDAFSEDDIIKKIEAGNVNLPLRSNLIKGAQSLFGIKTELQFARLRLTALVSQQRARQNNLKVQNGNNVTEFEIYPDEYDENRHFFISHFNRSEYEKALERVPYIATSFQIAQIEVWISDDRPEFQANSTLVAAIADLGEGNPEYMTNPNASTANCRVKTADQRCLPTNNANSLYAEIINDKDIVDIDKVSQRLQMRNLVQSRDFEVFRGRRLNSSEFTYHPKLGTISLNSRLRPNQVLAVAYNYYYTDKCDTLFQVGQLASSSIQYGDQTPPPNSDPDTTTVASPKVHFVKLIKPINQNTVSPLWDLMMKNVYPLRTSQLNAQDFEFDIYYENDFGKGELLKYIPEPKLRKYPLLQAFNLDRLNRYSDPQPDGIFDYISGVTVIENTGSVIFPVLEPFGRSLRENAIHYFNDVLGDSLTTEEISRLDSFYVYNELYDTTITIAKQSLQKNKFVMRGKVKGASNGIISLGPFIPKGSVRVTAGGKTLVEGQDYEIDYSLGTLRIINETYLAQGTPVNVSFEDNSVFNFQQKTMNGLRAEYTFDKNTILGATYLRYKERPFTGKVSIGDDPVSNQVIGVDFSRSAEVPWITKAVDKLPFYSTKEKSVVNFTSEAVLFLPGHNKFIDGNTSYNGIAHVDDFEGAITGFNLGSFNPNQWILSSTPPEFPEHELSNSLEYGANRAKLSWYVMDLGVTPNNNNSYTRQVLQTELFKLRETAIGQNALFTFDMSYYPDERGPYNFDAIGGYANTAGIRIEGSTIKLNNPKSRWGGIMRYFQNPDFEQANYEFIEFWLMNPFMERPDGIPHIEGEEGEIVFNLGNVSEDVIKDDILFFENALPTDNQPFPIKPTIYGRTTTSIPLVNGFDLQEGKQQDVGFDGIDNVRERTKYEAWLNSIGTIQEIVNDPAGDDFVFFNDPAVANLDLLERMKNFNGPEGNAPLDNNNSGNNQFIRGNRYPETEDMNNNRTLDKTESFYEYRVKLRNNGGFIDTTNLQYYKQSILVPGAGGRKDEVWYRFVVPLTSGKPYNGIAGYRSIQFMRTYVTNFESPKVFRMAEFQLLRSQWRRQNFVCESDSRVNPQLTLDEVGLQENSERLPFNYITPAGIVDQFVNQGNSNIRLDEKSLSLTVRELREGCSVGATKITRLDINQYKRLQLFVHAENKTDETQHENLAFVLRLGKDFTNNYYEYQIPVKLSNKGFPRTADSIWIKDNFVDLNLDSLLLAKTMRNEANVPATQVFSIPGTPGKGDTIRIIGNPSLGLVKVWYVGVKNIAKQFDTVAAEVWVNELRLVDFREKPAFAAQSRLQVQMADLAELNVSGNYSSQGYGALDQRIQQRQREDVLQYDVAVNLEAGKLLPKSLDVKAPVFAQYSNTTITPQYDAFDRDIEVRNKLKQAKTQEEKDTIRNRNIDQTIIKTFTVTNLRINKGKEVYPWSPKNFGFSYSFTENNRRTPIILEDKSVTRTIGLDYVYTRKSTYLQPLKFIKSEALKFLSELNFGYLPNNFSFNSKMVRLNNSRTYRLPDQPVFLFQDLRFTWDRNYALDWDITKSIRFNFRANATSLIDELRQAGIEDDPENRPWFDEYGNRQTVPTDIPVKQWTNNYRNQNILNLGRSKFYNHNASVNYRLPFNLIPILNWVSATADYKLTYGWEGGSLQPIDELNNTIGNVIQNGQNRGVNATFSFDKLYNKWNYLKSIETGKAVGSTPKRKSSNAPATSIRDAKKSKGMDMNDDKNDSGDAEKTADGKTKKTDNKKEDKPRDPTMAERILIRPLLSLRSVKFNYKEELSTMIPGYMQDSKILGLDKGFESPGLDFVAGLQPRLSGPDNWLQKNKQWFNDSKVFNNALQQNKRHNFDVKILIEPFKDFSIDVNFNKNYNQNHTEVFRAKGVIEGEFLQLAKYDVGAFDASYIALNTLFSDTRGLYNEFKANRAIISQRLPNIPGAGTDPETGQAYGYGPMSNAVNIPAFIATYTKQDPNTIALNQREVYSRYDYIPKPNWQVNYNGLSKIKGLKNVFSNFTIKHGYRSSIRVNKFETQPNYNETDPFLELSDNGNYFSRFEIPDMVINENFAPLLGISIKTKKDFKIDFEFKKSRNLILSQTQLQQSNNTEIVLGSGYTWKNFKGFSKKSKSKKRKKSNKAQSIEDAKNDPTNVQKGTTKKNRELKFNLAFSYRDDESLVFNLADGLDNPRADRGSTTISCNPTLEYDLNKNLALRYYLEYSFNSPKTSQSFPVTTIRSGIMFRFNLQ